MAAGLATALAASVLLPVAQSCSLRPRQTGRSSTALELPPERRAAWSDLRHRWTRDSFRLCLQASGIELSCGGCIRVGIPVHVRIDGTGRIHAEPLPGGSSCAKPPEPELRGCFIDTLEHLVAPPVLHDLEFDDSLGTGLSC